MLKEVPPPRNPSELERSVTFEGYGGRQLDRKIGAEIFPEAAEAVAANVTIHGIPAQPLDDTCLPVQILDEQFRNKLIAAEFKPRLLDPGTAYDVFDFDGLGYMGAPSVVMLHATKQKIKRLISSEVDASSEPIEAFASSDLNSLTYHYVLAYQAAGQTIKLLQLDGSHMRQADVDRTAAESDYLWSDLEAGCNYRLSEDRRAEFVSGQLKWSLVNYLLKQSAEDFDFRSMPNTAVATRKAADALSYTAQEETAELMSQIVQLISELDHGRRALSEVSHELMELESGLAQARARARLLSPQDCVYRIAQLRGEVAELPIS